MLGLLWCVSLLAGLCTSQAAADDLQYPVAIASQGEVSYIADRDLPGIWKLEGGKLTVFFQAEKKFRTPLAAIRCLAIDGEGRLLAGDTGTREIYRFEEGQPQPLTKSQQIGIPMAIVARGDSLWVSDLERSLIWRVPAGGGKAERLAEVPAPAAMVAAGEEAAAGVWLLSRGTQALFQVTPDGKAEAVVRERLFGFPQSLAVDAGGQVVISDSYQKCLWRMAPGQAPVKWVEGDSPLVYPGALSRAGDALLLADPRTRKLWRVTAEGQLEAVAATP